jgi:selenocysteine-specific elongation factor
VPVWFKSKLIIRNYSPQYLIGGGTVLNPLPPKYKRKDKKAIQLLKIRESCDIYKIIIEETREKQWKVTELGKTLFTPDNEFDNILQDVINSGKVKLISHYIIESVSFENVKELMINELNRFYKAGPDVKLGMPKEELRRKLQIEQELFEALIQQSEEIEVVKDKIRLKSWKALLSDEQIKELKRAEETTLRDKFCSFKDFNRDTVNILL